MTFALKNISLIWICLRLRELLCAVKFPNKRRLWNEFQQALLIYRWMFKPSFLSCVNFFFQFRSYLFLSLLYGTQVYSFAAIPAMLINFIGVIFEAGNETREKIWSNFGAEQKWRVERKRFVFVHTGVFGRARNWCVKKSSKRAKFFCSRAAFKSSIFQLLMVMRFDYDIVLVLGLLIAALIFSAGYYSAFLYFVELFFALPILPLFRHFAWNFFDFSRIVSLFCHSAQSPFKQQLLSKGIQNGESQYKKSKSEIETG